MLDSAGKPQGILCIPCIIIVTLTPTFSVYIVSRVHHQVQSMDIETFHGMDDSMEWLVKGCE